MFEVKNLLDLGDEYKDDFVAVAGHPNKNYIQHSSILIGYDKQILEFHYTGSKIEFNIISEIDCYYKKTEIIPTKLIPSLIGMCRNIQKRGNPKYGFFYGGEFYDSNGVHFSESPIKETMTCVGFCLNVFRGFLGIDYLLYTDWDKSTAEGLERFLYSYAEENGLTVEEIIESHRRITPLEFLTSGFFSNCPISKADIDFKIGEVQTYVSNPAGGPP